MENVALGRPHLLSGCGLLFGLTGAGMVWLYAIFTFTRPAEFVEPGSPLIWLWRLGGLLASCLAACLVYAGFWATAAKREWYVRSNELEIRDTLWRAARGKRYTGAKLVLGFEPGDGETPGGWALWLEAQGEKRWLASTNLRSLGVFLAEHTGWPLHAPEGVEENQD